MVDISPNAAPIKLREVHIRDFRAIERLDLSFVGPDGKTNGVAVLGGPNGSGKTSILEACLIAAGHGEMCRRPRGKEAVRAGARDYRIEACFECGGTCQWTQYGRNGKGRVGTEAGTCREFSAPKVPCLYFSSFRAPNLVGPVSITIGSRTKPTRSPPEWERLPALKRFLVDGKAYESMTRRAGAGAGAGDFGDSGNGKDNREYEETIRRLDEAWHTFYPGRTAHFSAEPVGGEARDGFDVFLVEEGRPRLPLDALSSGQLELINFVGWMLAERIENGIVVIDEPELHLDPQWHAAILRALRTFRPGCQFLVGTHSPAIFDTVYSYERSFLVAPDDPRAKAWDLENIEARRQAGTGR